MTIPTFAIPDPVPFDRLLSLEGRCPVVTGGSRGIGEAVVLRLAEAGACVVVAARGREGLAKIEAKVAAEGGQAACIQADAGLAASIFLSITPRCFRRVCRLR